jgi:hypothetical protein
VNGEGIAACAQRIGGHRIIIAAVANALDDPAVQRGIRAAGYCRQRRKRSGQEQRQHCDHRARRRLRDVCEP